MPELDSTMVRFMTANFEELEQLFLLVVRMGADYRELDESAIEWLKNEYGKNVHDNVDKLPNEQTLKCCWKTGKIAGAIAWGAGSKTIMKEHVEIGAKTVEARARALRAELEPAVREGLGTGC